MKMGRPITTTFQPDNEILTILKQEAENEDRSVSYMINYYLREGLVGKGKMKQKEKPKNKA
jgi:hypothetical protein